jgi:hypothetical protein
MKGSGTAADPYIINTSAGDTQFTDAQLALHKPGYRYSDSNGDDPPRRRRKTTYRDPLGRETGSSESNDALAGLTPSERARAEQMIADSNAWKNDASQYSTADPQTGMATRAIPASSATGDRWPLAAGAGNPCTSNGRPGTLVKSEDGSCLVCQVEPIRATRADAVTPRSMTAEEAQPARDAAYQQYCDEIRNAWRG